MPIYDFELLALVQELENETYFAEALLFPEICRHSHLRGGVVANLQNSIQPLLTRLPTVHLHGRRTPAEVELREVEIQVKPAKRTRYWSEPVPLTFHAVCWQQPGSHHAFVPALTIEVVGDSLDSMLEILPSNIEAELQRRGVTTSLAELLFQQRVVDLKLERTRVDLDVMTPKQRNLARHKQGEETSMLKEVGTLLNGANLPRAYELEEQVERLGRLLVGQTGRSVLLVGPSGVGKTALCYELVRQRRHHRLSGTSFWETTGARMMVGADGFGDWQDRCRKVLAEAAKSKAVLVLGNLFELAEIGRSGSSPEGMAGFFRPYLDRGEVLAVVECTPEQRDAMEKNHGHLLASFSVLEMERPEAKKVASILLSVARDERVGLESIETIERLHRRYATYSAYPGRPLRFLKELMAEVSGEIGAQEVARSFAMETGLPQFMIDDAMVLDLEKTKSFFSQRILGQTEAVDLIVDLLASVKAALTPPGRPIASLLFIGPTGVGKTEMARNLAQFLFQDRKRMVRFDMSEFADPYSVERLTGGQGSGQGLLTSKVREQPFGLVLFDELEKADPAFFDLLLQILGEGRLTDSAGRVADFTNSLVVMTSNLGAASFSKGPLGFRTEQGQQDHARKQFTSAVKAAFRPELFNRIDRLVPFAPLDRETAALVAQRELEALQFRDGVLHGNLELQIEPGVAEFLAGVGYDRRYGARPLKRAIEKELLGPLSEQSAAAAHRDVTAKVSVLNQALNLEVTVQAEGGRRAKRDGHAQIPNRALECRRRAQRVLNSQPAHELRNRIHRLERLKSRHARRGYVPEEEAARVARLPFLQKLLKRLQGLLAEGRGLESEALLAYQGYQQASGEIADDLRSHTANMKRLILELYSMTVEEPNQATVIIYRGKGASHEPLLKGYFEVFKALKLRARCFRLSLEARPDPDPDDGIVRLDIGEELVNRVLKCEQAPLSRCCSNDLLGVALEVSGDMAFPLMLGETGLHVFTNPVCEVVVLREGLEDYKPPPDLHLRRDLVGKPRRQYLAGSGIVNDLNLGRRYAWSGKALGKILVEAIPDELDRVAEKACQ